MGFENIVHTKEKRDKLNAAHAINNPFKAASSDS